MHNIQLLPILVAGFVPMVIGMLWYGPVFGRMWLALMETTQEEIMKDFNPMKSHGVSFLLALATAFVLQQLLLGGGLMVGVHIALLATVGFLLPLSYQTVVFERRRAGLAVLHFGYNAVALIGQAMVLSLWN